MHDEAKTKEQLIIELCRLRERIAELEKNLPEDSFGETGLQETLQRDREVPTKGEGKFIPEEPFTDGDATDERWAEQSQGKSEQRFLTVVKNSPNPMFIMKEGCFAFVNDAVIRLYGAESEKELLGRDVMERVHPDHRAGMRKRIRSACELGKPTLVLEQRHLKLNGKIMDVEVNLSHICHQKSESVQVFVRDISEQKRTEDALGRTWLYTRSLIESSLDPLMSVSLEGKITDANKAAEMVVGCPRKHLIESDFCDYYTEPEKAMEGFRKVISDGFVKDYPLTIRHTSGRLTDVLYNATVYMDESGQVQGVFAAARDITDLKRAEEALRESRAYLSAIMENIPFEFWVMGPDDRYTMQNRTSRERFGDIVGKRAEDVCLNKSMLEIWQSCNRRGFAGELVEEEVVYSFGDEERYCFNVVAPINDTGGILGILGICVDITDRKRIEAALERANEKLESLVEERTEELSSKNRRLEEFNAALKILLTQREEDKKDLEESILANVKGSIIPFLKELKKTRLDENQEKYLRIVETRLEEIVSPFLSRLSSRFTNLTPMEIKVAKFVREGMTSKEIAQILGVAEQTILTHRNNLRAKLGLRNEKTNLHSHLMNLK